MKTKAIFFLTIFSFFIVSPFLLRAGSNMDDISIIYTLSEEEDETHKFQKIIASLLYTQKLNTTHFQDLNISNKFLTDTNLRIDNGFVKIALPPPEPNQYIS